MCWFGSGESTATVVTDGVDYADAGKATAEGEIPKVALPSRGLPTSPAALGQFALRELSAFGVGKTKTKETLASGEGMTAALTELDRREAAAASNQKPLSAEFGGGLYTGPLVLKKGAL
jgi:hypothetical protein